jgi:hypothetical protein
MRTGIDISRYAAPGAVASAALLVFVLLAVTAPAARAQTYDDVPKAHWARAQIAWVTNQGAAGAKLLDDYDTSVTPDQAITRAQLARAVVIASGPLGDEVDETKIADLPSDDPYYHAVAVALDLGLMSGFKDGFHPAVPARAWEVDRAVLRALRLMYADHDWSMLATLGPGRWEPNDGWKIAVPRQFSTEIAARYFAFHYNHPTADDKQEVSPREPIERDEAAYVLYQALHLTQWRIDGLKAFNDVSLPDLTKRQKTIVEFACRYAGYPYVWAGEYPTRDSPYGLQAHGGFDCSGFVWWVMKIHFGYRLDERVAADMAAAAKKRIARRDLVPGDIIFWGPEGPKSKPSSIYHAGLYLGKGWFIHSTGSSDGVSLNSLNWDGWSWKTDFAWGRRVLKAGEFIVPTASSRAADLIGEGPQRPRGAAGSEAP